MAKPKDRTGIKYGSLTVVNVYGKQNSNYTWLCQCDCGNQVIVNGSNLTSGKSTSCGCTQKSITSIRTKIHGACATPNDKLPCYRKWENMKYRCYNANGPHYKDYGGRGIIVCGEWLNDYVVFRDYVKSLPNCPINLEILGAKLDRELDRYPNNDGNYEPGNVRWATRREQMQNRRTSILVKSSDGTCYPLMDIVQQYGRASYKTVLARIKSKWTLSKALLTPTTHYSKFPVHVRTVQETIEIQKLLSELRLT